MTDKGLLRAAAICWAIALGSVACGLLAGCDSLTGPDTVSAGTSNEVFILEISHDLAAQAGISVDPKITHDIFWTTCSDGTQCPAAGWVPNGGRSRTIYYWAGWVNEPCRYKGPECVPQKRLEDVARHEVAHVACQCDLGEGK